MNDSGVLVTNGHRCSHRGLVKYPSVDKKLWDPSSTWILQWDNIVKHPGARARGCHCDVHKPPWLYPDLVGKDADEPDRAIKSAPVKRATSGLQKRSQFGPAKSLITTPGQAGAVDEESFLNAFEDVPSVKLFSAKDLEEQMKQIRETIGDDKKDWKQRTESLKKIRGIIVAGGLNYDNFMELLKSIQRPFEGACTDLRSQVVREACITLAFLSHHLKNRFSSFVEAVLLSLLNLIQNSAKVVASAGAVALRFIFQNTHSGRFIPIIADTLGNKSKDIRRASCEYLNLILQTWPTSILQKHVTVLQGAIKKGVADSDSEARAFARKSYWAFKDHFPEPAEVLLNSLDATYKRSLMALSNSGSLNSLNAVARTTNISPRASRPGIAAAGRTTPGPRSTSAIDLQAAKRAHARTIYANLNRLRATPPRMNRTPDVNTAPTTERIPRTRVAGVSQSQPGSRSGSPSSRSSYATYNRDGESLVPRPRRLSGQGIRSTGTSREPSPQRFIHSSTPKIRGRNIYMSQNDRPPSSRPVMAQKMLQQSLEAESALADALTFDTTDYYQRGSRAKGDHSDDSETSSMCSERSMDGVRRHSDDIREIIDNCGRKSWSERKEGLVCLQYYLANGNTLNASELRTITDIFAKMFMDTHTKVFSLFLDTLNELITTHNDELGDWLYVLCARLLNKLGTDLLGSVQAKIHKTLDVVREYFPGDLLLSAVMRFLTDPTQTPNSRVKVSTLTFLTHVAESSEPSALNSTCGSALARLLDWTNDVKSQDVRRHAQDAVIALYNLNPPQFPMILGELPQFYQDAAMPLVQNHLRRSSGHSNPASPGTQPGRSPHSPARTRTKMDIDMNDPDNLNPEEVYKSLRRTTAEIQNYGFERATTSKDSGIHNMADVEEKLESLTLTSSGRSSSVSSPTQRGRTGMNVGVNGSSDTMAGDLILPQDNNGYDTHSSSPDVLRGPEVLDNTIQTLQSTTAPNYAKVQALQDFQLYVAKADAPYIKQHFKKLLKSLLDRLTSPDKELEIQVLQTLIEMLKRPDLVESFSKFAELLVLKVLDAHKSEDPQQSVSMDTSVGGSTPSVSRAARQVQGLKTAEKCAAMIATVLPADQVIRLSSSSITTERFPKNMGAIKMLHAAVEHHGREAIEPHLPKIMPGLITAYDDAESKVRKTAVFCMVAIHNAVGQEVLEPHLAPLYGSKLKLLNIYIQRSPTSRESTCESPEQQQKLTLREQQRRRN